MPNDIPIVGQAVVADWALTLTVTCTCGRSFIVHGRVGEPCKCRGCSLVYIVNGFELTPSGDLKVRLGQGRIISGKE